MSETILVTGASGYIGSHTVLALVEAGHDVIALENSNSQMLQKVEKLTNKSFRKFKCNLLDLHGLQIIFTNNSIDIVIHLAATKGINACTQTPVDFYKNNIVGLINLLTAMKEKNVKKLIFSSSCAVYGDQKLIPVAEDAAPNPQNVYARTKYFAEEILRDVASADESLSIIILRYFNPIGAHTSGKIGEDPNKQNLNILTLIAKNALGELKDLKISPECVRDFIHVMDAAEAHVVTIEKLKSLKGVKIYNIGSGVGTSLQKLIKTFEDSTSTKINYTPKPCDVKEIKEIIADTKLMRNELKFVPKRTLGEMCIDCWKFILSE